MKTKGSKETAGSREDELNAEAVADQMEATFERLGLDEGFVVGFFAALATGPDPVPRETWMAALLEEDDEEDDDPAAVARGPRPEPTDGETSDLEVFSRAVGELLREHPEDLCPEPDDVEFVEYFCNGYLAGAELHETWQEDETASQLLYVFAALGDALDEPIVDDDDKPLADPEAWLAKHRAGLGELMADLHAYWQKRRIKPAVSNKVGRNDACPCGSGKKYKKCCSP